MKTSDQSVRIKELRMLSGSSQMELAEQAQLSLRTIQRIESGQTQPRGDTLKRLSKALNVSPDELIEIEEQGDKPFLIMLNLSAMSFIVFPLLGVIVPLVLWAIKRDRLKSIDTTGKSVLNFQITWLLLFIAVDVLMLSIKIDHIGFRLPGIHAGGLDLLLIMVMGLYLFNIIFIVVNAIRVNYGKHTYYFAAIPFLR
jgi:uncharacterized Tic20 family protein